MKNRKSITAVICLILFCTGIGSANAATYYFSWSTGDDTRTIVQAQNPSTPWKSIVKLNAIFSSLRPGDNILFRRGDVFEGAITITASGSNGNPIVLGGYGAGANPVISGLTALSGWTTTGGGIWEAAVPQAGAGVNIVLINGSWQAIGRYPNSNTSNGGYLSLESHSGNASITDNQLSGSPNWGGGEVVIRKNHWVLDRNKITAHNGTTINYQSSSGYEPTDNFGYFIQNHPKTLDQNGEWYYDAGSKRLGVYSTSGAPSSVEASTVNTLVTINTQSFVTLQNLTFKGANQNTFELSNAHSIQILNCDVLYSGANAVLGLGSNHLHVEGCTIYHTNNSALELRNSGNAFFKNNIIRCTGTTPGMGNGDSGSYEAVLIDGDNETVELNTIDSTGYIPITFRGNVNFIKNNFISNYNTVKDDGGGIYTWNNIAGAPPTYGSKIIGNILLNGIGAPGGTNEAGYKAANGIYMDDNTAGVEISDNVVANCGLYGLYVHNGHDLTILNNTFYNSESQMVLAHDNYAAYAPVRNITLTGNIFFSKDNSQLLAEFKTPDNDIAGFGTFNNNYYCRPTYESYVINTSYQPEVGHIDLNEWKALYGKDAASTKFPVAAVSYDHIRFEYNASSASKTISLDGTYIDARNVTYNGTITLTPFGSAVLVKQVAPTALCPGTGSITREQWNNTANGDFSAVPFQTAPTKTSVLTGALETFNIGEAYGSRIRGFICPPQTGAYTFWIAGDDLAELWLSTDEAPGNKRRIAALTTYTAFRDWTKSPSQKSVPITLQAGQHYYIEVLQKEGGGGDHVSVAWQLPDGIFEGPIPGTRLSPAVVAGGVQAQTITFPALAATTMAAGPVTLTATASSGLPVSFSVVSGPAAIAGNILTPTAAGTVVIKASQSGNAQYNPAPDVTQNLVIQAAGNAQCAATGSILREQWDGIGGGNVSQIPLTTNPSSTTVLTQFEAPVNITDSYGSRIRGYICPPQTGNYTFYVAGDDATELWLSANESPSNKIKIAYNTAYTGFREWNKYSTQKSTSIYLQAGQKYYVEALHKEDFGGDHLSVAWQRPDGVLEAPIAGSRLSPFTAAASLADQSIAFAPLADFTLGGAAVTLSATASSGLPVSFSIVSGPATLAGNLVTPTAAGIVVIKASQAGNTQYNPAPDITRQLMVTATSPLCAATGSILREQWNNITGNGVAQIPQSLPPNLSGQLALFEAPTNVGESYGSRIRGYICPPQTGNYTFYIAGDDATELWLSTNESPSNKIKIAYNTDYTGFREWNKYSTQKSTSIYLQAGQKYYVEALHKEIGGGDHLSVAWNRPDGVLEAPIAGSRLSPFEAATALMNQTINFPLLPAVTLGAGAVTLAATASSGLPVSFSLVSGSATIAGGSITPTGAGIIMVKASQGGNAVYSAAPDVIQNLVVTASAQPCSATGSILREQWDGINGNDIAQIPQSSPPTSAGQLTVFEGPKDFSDRYGSRIRGYICPPQTGNYIFRIAGDDATELWLSSNESPSNKIRIAYSLSWTAFREWDRYASQKSVAIYLQAGSKYYIEALQKEGAGGDHLSVGWQLPDGVFEGPIAGTRLSPYLLENNQNTRSVATVLPVSIQSLPGTVIKDTATEQRQDYQSSLKAFPNPFSYSTLIEIVSMETGAASVDVYDGGGRKLHNLFTGAMQKGMAKQLRLDGSRLLPGVYFVRFTSAKGVMNYKVILSR